MDPQIPDLVPVTAIAAAATAVTATVTATAATTTDVAVIVAVTVPDITDTVAVSGVDGGTVTGGGDLSVSKESVEGTVPGSDVVEESSAMAVQDPEECSPQILDEIIVKTEETITVQNTSNNTAQNILQNVPQNVPQNVSQIDQNKNNSAFIDCSYCPCRYHTYHDPELKVQGLESKVQVPAVWCCPKCR